MTERHYKCYGEDCVEIDRKWLKKDLIKYKGKNYCQNCYKKITYKTQMMNIIKHKICKYYRIKYPTPMMFNQIKKYISQKITYEEIVQCLDYQKQVKGFPGFKIKFGLAFIPYVAPKIIEQNIINHSNTNNPSMVYDIIDISIKKNQLDSDIDNEYKKSKLIDMSNEENFKNG